MTDPAPTIRQEDEKLALELLELAGDLFEIEAGDKAVPEFIIRIARHREAARRDALEEAAKLAIAWRDENRSEVMAGDTSREAIMLVGAATELNAFAKALRKLKDTP